MEAATNTYQRQADTDRRNALITQNLDYVRHILARLVAELPPGIDEENLLSAGTLGLIEAANKFDPNRGVAFKTFAYPRVRGSIVDELRRNCPLPQRVLDNMSLIRAARLALPAPTTIDLLAEYTGLSLKEVEECIQAARLTASISIANSEESLVGKQTTESAESKVEATEVREIIADSLASLPERERICVTLYYLQDLRLKEIGAVLEISASRVSRILSRGEFQLREKLRSLGMSGSGL